MSKSRRMNNKAQRIKWIDTAKGIGILLVMFGHNYLDWKYVFWAYSFHMALFFFLCGCTFKVSADFKSFFIKRVKGLLVPYLLFAFIITAYNWLSAVTHGNFLDITHVALSYLTQTRYTHLWFLPCLFVAELGTWLISRCVPGNRTYIWLPVAIVQMCVFFAYRALVGKDLLWNADLAVLGMGFISSGIWYRNAADDFIDKRCLRLPIVFGVLLFHVVAAYLAFSLSGGSVDWYNNRFGNPLLFAVAAVVGTLTSVLISKKLKLRILTYIGENSIVWYGLHRVVIDATFIIYNKLGIVIERGSLLSVVLATVSTALAVLLLVPVNVILTRYFPFLIGKGSRKDDKHYCADIRC